MQPETGDHPQSNVSIPLIPARPLPEGSLAVIHGFPDVSGISGQQSRFRTPLSSDIKAHSSCLLLKSALNPSQHYFLSQNGFLPAAINIHFLAEEMQKKLKWCSSCPRISLSPSRRVALITTASTCSVLCNHPAFSQAFYNPVYKTDWQVTIALCCIESQWRPERTHELLRFLPIMSDKADSQSLDMETKNSILEIYWKRLNGWSFEVNTISSFKRRFPLLTTK